MADKKITVADKEITMTSIQGLADRWGCSRSYVWQKCRKGTIPTFTIGQKWFIPMRWVKEKENESN